MATRWAVASGNWSNPAIWNGGTLPQPGDSVHANTFTVTIDQNIDVALLSNENGGKSAPYDPGGTFTVGLSAPTLDAGEVRSGSATCLTISGRHNVDLVANIYGPSQDSGGLPTVKISGGWNVNITGNCYGTVNRPALEHDARGGKLIGNVFGATSGSVAFGNVIAVEIADGVTMIGNSQGGSIDNAIAVEILQGAYQRGNATGGSAISSIGTRVFNGGMFEGNVYRGAGLSSGLLLDGGFAWVKFASGVGYEALTAAESGVCYVESYEGIITITAGVSQDPLDLPFWRTSYATRSLSAPKTEIHLFVGELVVIELETDEDYRGRNLEFVVETMGKKFVASVSLAGMTVAAGSVSFPTPAAVTQCKQKMRWALWDLDAHEVLKHGTIAVDYAAQRT
ncbi:MAG: hypothetical protein NXI32_22905 [bacterium]|nr:hypothetical protein [bacterium]